MWHRKISISPHIHKSFPANLNPGFQPADVPKDVLCGENHVLARVRQFCEEDHYSVFQWLLLIIYYLYFDKQKVGKDIEQFSPDDQWPLPCVRRISGIVSLLSIVWVLELETKVIRRFPNFSQSQRRPLLQFHIYLSDLPWVDACLAKCQ